MSLVGNLYLNVINYTQLQVKGRVEWTVASVTFFQKSTALGFPNAILKDLDIYISQIVLVLWIDWKIAKILN